MAEFDQEIWRAQVAESLGGFNRNPHQDLSLAGTGTLLGYLVVRTLEPWLAAFEVTPVAAVLALAEMTRGPGADRLVQRAVRLRFQAAALIERELRSRDDLRGAVEQILVTLNVIHMARQRLNSSRDEWLRLSLLAELDSFGASDFVLLRRLLHDPGWQSRYEAIRGLRVRNGAYTAADLVLIHDGLNDSAVHVRAAAARILSLFTETPPQPLVNLLMRVAIYDSDVETRFAAARTMGALRDRIASPQLVEHLGRCLGEPDHFVRSAAAIALGELGELAGSPAIIASLIILIDDNDPYTREAAARTLGRMGTAAATAPVMRALTHAMGDGDSNVHAAALDTLMHLRRIRATLPLVR